MAYRECKNCGNDEAGTTIYGCENCGKIYCEDCLPNGDCGNCGETWFPTIESRLPFGSDNLNTLGSIEDREDDEEESEND